MELECPECGSPHTRWESKLIDDGKIQRICECKICHHRWNDILEIYDKLPEKYKKLSGNESWMKPMPIYVLEKEYRITIDEGTIGQNIDSLIEDFKVVGEDIIDLGVKGDCIALRTHDTKMRWENRAKLFIPDIELIQIWKTTK